MEKNRNYYLAIVLSVLIVFVWQFFYMGPKMDAQQKIEQAQQAELAKQQKANKDKPVVVDASGQPVPGAEGTNIAVIDRQQALQQADRVVIDTPALSGSINLTGARFDDLQLKKYRETIDKDSPIITLLNPGNTKDGYFVELGFTGGNQDVAVPGMATKWTVDGNNKLTPETPVTLTHTDPSGVTFTREIKVDQDYMFTVTDTVKNGTAADLPLTPYGRIVRYTIPAVAAGYVLHEGYVGVLDGVLQETTFAKDSEPVKHPGIKDGWFGITDKYWAAAIVPSKGVTFDTDFSHLTKGQPLFQADYRELTGGLKAGETKSYTTHVFAGAKEVPVVDRYQDEYQITDFYKLIDWGWFKVITRPMFKLMDWLYKYFGNFGLAILGTTVIVKLLFFPIANRQYASMAKMKTLQPKMEELKTKFGDDKMGLQTAMMQLYKEEKVNPLAGCWPVLLQIPVFFALYKVIYITIEMRHAPFYGWIQDLSAPDPTTIFNLFGLIPWTPPHALMLGVWPIIMGITMFVQMRMNPTPPDPTQAMIFTWMPLVFTFMLAAFPAGLVIYWAWNNTLSVIQQGIIMKRNGAKIELFDNLKGLFRRKPSSA
ncbi:membrane protein insertase YidC [Rhizobium sp. KVB221]|uniref:Membrane protein insertase YidC n=1 Tax=Rhizobium setariae TaxID=2801340 RepID=A0A936YMM3_9HYPH|nr:membrane protein insertase YidC [Rhizobium setariae]MBL0371522.1 membrane protein insertase YidC [Rhizobium setariae]